MRPHPAPRTVRQRPLGEPEPGYRAGSTAHVHGCICGYEYLHTDRFCIEPYWRVAVGCLPVTPRREG